MTIDSKMRVRDMRLWSTGELFGDLRMVDLLPKAKQFRKEAKRTQDPAKRAAMLRDADFLEGFVKRAEPQEPSGC